MFKPSPPSIPARYKPRGLEILHEDKDLLVVEKEPGLLTMSYHRDDTSSAAALLTKYLRKGSSRSERQAWVVHRLDRETSGLLVFAKSESVQRALKENWSATEKIYLAAVHGALKEKSGELSSYLAENDAQFVRVVAETTPGARLCRTAYTVIHETGELSLLRIRLLTGRKNQIRVQFAHCGHPVAGDPKYDRKDRFHERMALHALLLAFDHPTRRERVEFCTPVPPYFLKLAPGLTRIFPRNAG